MHKSMSVKSTLSTSGQPAYQPRARLTAPLLNDSSSQLSTPSRSFMERRSLLEKRHMMDKISTLSNRVNYIKAQQDKSDARHKLELYRQELTLQAKLQRVHTEAAPSRHREEYGDVSIEKSKPAKEKKRESVYGPPESSKTVSETQVSAEVNIYAKKAKNWGEPGGKTTLGRVCSAVFAKSTRTKITGKFDDLGGKTMEELKRDYETLQKMESQELDSLMDKVKTNTIKKSYANQNSASLANLPKPKS